MPRPPRHATRLAAAGVLAASLTAAAGLPGAPAADAAPVDRCGSDGTEWVPDRGPGFDFADSCLRHDLCYGLKPHGSGFIGRMGCDLEFLVDLYDQCNQQHSNIAARAACDRLAEYYHFGVRVFGGGPFRRAEVPTGTVTVGDLEVIRDEAPSGGGRGGGGGGFVGGGGGFIGGGTVTVGKPEKVETQAE